MTIFEATQMSVLMGNLEVTSLVGDRLFPEALPENPVLPAITYQLISSPRVMTQQGPSLAKPRYRWSCWATTYDEAVAAAIAVIRALRTEGINAWADEESDRREPNTGLFRRMVETLSWTTPEELL
jgi:hypothetical protein